MASVLAITDECVATGIKTEEQCFKMAKEIQTKLDEVAADRVEAVL